MKLEKRIAIIGYGGMGGWHINTLNSLTDIYEIAGVYDINPARLEVAHNNRLNVYNTLEELLNDNTIDVVTVATPNNFHKPLSIACLKAGKNVVCEKPVMMNSKDLEEVIATAKECNKVFTVHQNRRFDADFVTIKEIINTDLIGYPYMIESRVQGSRRVLCEWRGVKEAGGGMILDWGVHLIDQFLYLIDSPVVEVMCHAYYLMPGVEVDDSFKAVLRFENGISALVEVDTNCFIPLPRWHLQCFDGTAVINDWGLNGHIIKLSNEDEMAWEESIVYTEAGPTRTMAPRPRETVEELPLPQIKTDILDYYRTVAKAIDGLCEPPVTFEQMTRVMKVVDACFEAAEKGCSVKTRI